MSFKFFLNNLIIFYKENKNLIILFEIIFKNKNNDSILLVDSKSKVAICLE